MSHTENTSKTRKSIDFQARMFSKVEDNGKRELKNIFSRYPDKWIIYIWNAFSNTVCQMLVKTTSSKNNPNRQNIWVTTQYSSSLRVLSCPACLTLNRKKVTSMLCSTEIFIMDLYLLKRERNEHHSEQWKRNHTSKQEDGISIQHKPSHVREQKKPVNLDFREDNSFQ